MRLWSRRRAPLSPAPPGDDLLLLEETLRRRVADVMDVRARQIRGGVVVFRGPLTTERTRALATIRERFDDLGYTPFVRADGDGVVVQAWPTADVTVQPRRALATTLFVLTCLSTLLAGAAGAGLDLVDLVRAPRLLLAGVPFAATLLAILGVHEFGHYFTARRYHAAVSLPYFIPAPPPFFLFGTMGAIIRMRSAVRDRNSLLDIAAAGPLAGLVLAVPALVLGLMWSVVQPVPQGVALQFGDSALTWALTRLTLGRLPDGFDVFMHPVAFAGWAGLFVTALNLFPVGQLDGGRIAYALFGRRHRAVGYAAFTGTIVLGVLTRSVNWFVWGVFIAFLVGFVHPAPIDDLTPLSPRRRAVGLACLVLFALLVPPVPLRFV